MNSALKRIFGYVKEKEASERGDLCSFPALWDVRNETLSPFECKKSPFSFYRENIEYVLRSNKDYSKVTPADMRIYSAHLRSLTAYPHGSELLNPDGTFIKTILLLPYLKKIGINTLYLLPIVEPSMHTLKGELPSPYASKSFYRLDPILDDRLMGHQFSVDEQFSALVEACHNMGIKVILDFVFRTVGRDHEWLFEYPEWFIWIDKKNEEIRVPEIKHLAYDNPDTLVSKQIEPEDVPLMFRNAHLKDYLSIFKDFPEEALRRIRNREIVDLKSIEKELGLTTVPAFSDWFNDPQPPWSDITYLRFYLDHPTLSKAFLNEEQPPYLLYDVIHCNSIPGEIKNQLLWNRLSYIIPFYQKKFSIDGARIDMSHSMPPELINKIIRNAKEVNQNFVFISEDFNMDPNSEKLQKGYYDIFLGNLWFYETPSQAKNLKEVLYSRVAHFPIPLISTSETADSCRTAARSENPLEYSKALYLINSFMPNSNLFINSGFELLEKTALNGALASEDSPAGKDTGKIAFFDHAHMDWNNGLAREFLMFLRRVNELRGLSRETPSMTETNIRNLIVIRCTPFFLLANFSDQAICEGLDQYFVNNLELCSKKDHTPGKLDSLEVILTRESPCPRESE